MQDNKEALVWIERAEVAAPEVPLMVFFRSVLLAMAGEEYQARAAMQRYLATDNAPVRTIPQWYVRMAHIPLSSYGFRFLLWAKKFNDGLKETGLPW